MTEAVFLRQFLEPLAPWLRAETVSEILCNAPGAVWVERLGHVGMERHAVPELTAQHIDRLARQVAGFTAQECSRQRPLLSATLPTGERIQFVMPPASREGAFAIRKQALRNLSLEDFEQLGAFATTTLRTPASAADDRSSLDSAPSLPQSARAFLAHAVHARKNILISGGTSTAKTTLLNALAKEIPPHEHIVTIEDARELRLPQPNQTSLVASRGDQGEAAVDMQDLLDASLRLRPDRILLGEIRGKEAWTFLEALGSGHSGSFSTVHADSPALAFERLGLIVMRAGLGLGRREILDYLRFVVDVVIQLVRTADGRRVVSEIHVARP